MKDAALALDDTRPFHYEGDHFLQVSDVISTMYPQPKKLERIAQGEKPVWLGDAPTDIDFAMKIANLNDLDETLDNIKALLQSNGIIFKA